LKTGKGMGGKGKLKLVVIGGSVWWRYNFIRKGLTPSNHMEIRK